MKDTKPRGPTFRPQFSAGATARMANSDSAAHGAEMDAPEIIPAGGCENTSACSAYVEPRAIIVTVNP